jgi:GrpB-like predicted nucleotidyltransferase (UPF0157 family)
MNPTLKMNVEVVPYSPTWPEIYKAERAVLSSAMPQFVALEHVGSTAVPGQAAKPVIDMMAAVLRLDEVKLGPLTALGYHLIDAGFQNRLFLRRYAENGQMFHLHIVEYDTWEERNERLMRDYLLSHPEAVQAYGELKSRLALQFSEDSVAYTKAKTDFIQGIIDKARDERGLPRVDVWEE